MPYRALSRWGFELAGEAGNQNWWFRAASGRPWGSTADILRIEDGIFVEHWDVIQDEETQ
jgi:hypothetical protein